MTLLPGTYSCRINKDGTIVIDDNADRSKCTVLYSDIDSEPTKDLNDACLDSKLLDAGVKFDNPNHMVHYLDYSVLRVLVEGYYKELGERVHADLDGDQLRKLALWLYAKLGGTRCGQG